MFITPMMPEYPLRPLLASWLMTILLTTDAGDETVETFGSDEYQDDSSALFNVAEQPFRIQLLAQYMAKKPRLSYQHASPAGAAVLEMDTDNAAVQDLILAAENIPEIKKYDMPALWKFTSA
jgi:exodeoxyribonuclease VIII